MKLYELTQDYAHVMEMAEELDAETLQDTLDAIQEEIDDKAENIAKLIRTFQAEAEVIKTEEKRLADRRKSIENKESSLKSYLQNQLELAGLTKVKRPTVTVSIQNNPPSVDIADESLIPADYKVPQPDKVDKKSILAALKDGAFIEGCSMKQTRGIRIR